MAIQESSLPRLANQDYGCVYRWIQIHCFGGTQWRWVFPILSMWGLQWTHPGYYWSLIWLQLWKCIMDPWITPVWASRVNCAYFCHLKYQTCVIIKGWLGAIKNTCTCIELWTRNNWLEYSTVKLLCLVQGGKKCSIWWLMGLLS